jgi:excisionase family DNA binding protein
MPNIEHRVIRDPRRVHDYLVGSDGSVWRRRSSSESSPKSKWHEVFHAVLADTGAGRPAAVYVHNNLRPVPEVVLEAFVGPRPEGKAACFRDGDAANACKDNLFWGTPAQAAEAPAAEAPVGQAPVGKSNSPPAPEPPAFYLRPSDLADRYAVPLSTILGFIRSGKLRAIKVGRLWRVRPGDWQEFLDVCNSAGVPPAASLAHLRTRRQVADAEERLACRRLGLAED